MDKEVLTCLICKNVLWDPVIVPCCLSPFCYSCLQELESSDLYAKCVVCHKDWTFDKSVVDVKYILIDLQSFKVYTIESHF
jgi:hypothetical protein